MIELIDALIARGVECRAVLPEESDMTTALESRRVPLIVSRFSRWTREKPMPWRNRFLEKPLVHLLRAIKLAWLIRGWRCDVIVTNTLTLCEGALAAKILAVPHVTYAREFGDLDHGLYFEWGPRLSMRLLSLLSRRVVFNSRALASHYRRQVPPVRARVIYNAVHVPAAATAEVRPEPPTREGPFACVLVGWLTPAKGHELAIRAIAELVRRGVPVTLKIIGGYGPIAYRRSLQQLIDSLRLAAHVEMVEHTSDPGAFFRQADVALMCSRMEAFGRVTVEAMKHGTPVIGARSGGTRELIAEGVNGLLYSPGDATELADKIQRLAEDREVARRMGERARRWAIKTFSLDRYGDEFLTILGEVTGPRARRSVGTSLPSSAGPLSARAARSDPPQGAEDCVGLGDFSKDPGAHARRGGVGGSPDTCRMPAGRSRQPARMRILFVVGQFPALSETFVLNQVTGLIDRGHEVDIYAIGTTQALKGVVQPDVLRYGLTEQAFYAPAIPRRRLSRVLWSAGLVAETAMRRPTALAAWGRPRRAGPPAGAWQFLYRATPILRRKPYDIIHCQFGSIAQPLATLQKVGAVGGGLVVSFRGQDISRYVQQHGGDVYREVFETGDVFLPNCAYFQRRLLALGCDPRRVIVHRSGLDCTRFTFAHRHPPLERPVRILMIGRLVEKKGMEYGIRALARVAGGGYRVELVIVGDGPLALQLSALARDLGVAPLLQLTGWQDARQIAGWLATSHLLMAPSVTAADGDEDAPVNVLKEAMATGMPVIGTRHGGIPELVEDGISGFLVPERDAEALADRLRYLVNNPQVWPAMGEAGRAFVARHYDLNRLNDRLVEIYRGVVSKSDRRRCHD